MSQTGEKQKVMKELMGSGRCEQNCQTYLKQKQQ